MLGRKKLRSSFVGPLLANGPPMQVDANYKFEIEFIREMGLIKGHEGSGPDGLLTSFFKGSRVLLMSELPKLTSI